MKIFKGVNIKVTNIEISHCRGWSVLAEAEIAETRKSSNSPLTLKSKQLNANWKMKVSFDISYVQLQLLKWFSTKLR